MNEYEQLKNILLLPVPEYMSTFQLYAVSVIVNLLFYKNNKNVLAKQKYYIFTKLSNLTTHSVDPTLKLLFLNQRTSFFNVCFVYGHKSLKKQKYKRGKTPYF